VRDAAMVRSIIDLCGHFEVLVMAEGVETPSRRSGSSQWLRVYPGPLVAQPMMAEDVAHWSRARVR
jgi:EAL domain-containing protein (putative c-di-GMP-specific phosphodiesterase class I)